MKTVEFINKYLFWRSHLDIIMYFLSHMLICLHIIRLPIKVLVNFIKVEYSINRVQNRKQPCDPCENPGELCG